MRSLQRAAVLACLVTGVLGFNASAAVFVDNFNDNRVNTAAWGLFQESGITVQETNQRLEITVPSSASGSQFGGGLASTWGITGDTWAMQVDYQLLTWPAGNGIRIGLVPTWWSVQRDSWGKETSQPGEGFCLDSYFGNGGSIRTTGSASGTLRIVRNGSVVTSYYGQGSAWNTIWSANYGSNGIDIPWVNIMVWTHDYAFSNQPVKIALDNFIINSGTMTNPPVPEPSALVALSGLCGAFALRMRRRA